MTHPSDAHASAEADGAGHHHHHAANETGIIPPSVLRHWFGREARFGVAALLSFCILVTVLVINKGRGKENTAESGDSPGKGEGERFLPRHADYRRSRDGRREI